jgi:hypothetical protein
MEETPELNSGHNSTRYRELDARIGRWWSVDPAAALYYSWSPYNLSICSPLINSDPSGATVTPTQDGFDQLNIGLEATLGQNHGFSRDQNTGQLTYTQPANINLNQVQQEIVNKLNDLIDNPTNVNVSVISRTTNIPLSGGNSFTLAQLGANGANGATVADIDPNSQLVTGDINVYLADLPVDDNGEVMPDHHKGRNALHELGGHAWLRLFQTNINTRGSQAQHNTLTEDFETRFRQIYLTGRVFNNKPRLNDYNKVIKKINKSRRHDGQPLLPKAKMGDPETLLGTKAARH